jgi:hypothetical protein
MEVQQFLRVVSLRKGKLHPTEFRLREGEKGLSLFAHQERPGPARVIEAVRGAGKKGDLRAAAMAVKEFWNLGLTIVQTKGGTAFPEVNAVHYEARLPWWRMLLVRLRGRRPHDYFNEYVSPKLWATARLLD